MGRGRRRVHARAGEQASRGLMRRVAPAHGAGGRAQERLSRLAPAQDGFTLVELLVVSVILVILVGALTQLFVSATNSAAGQTQRAQAQQDVRLAVDKLRREIHCASDVSPTSGYPSSSITITLGTYCPTYDGSAKVTWCVKDKAGNSPPAAGGPYTLWRYSSNSCSGSTGRAWATNIVDATAVTNGGIFVSYSAPTQPAMAPPVPTLGQTSGSLGSLIADTPLGYVVDPVTAAGEQPGLEATVTLAAGTSGRSVTLDWSGSCPPYSGITSYKVYGRTPGAERLLATIPESSPCQTTSYTDSGALAPSGSAPTGRLLATIGVDIPIRIRPSGSGGLFELTDSIALRNTPR
jgi:prepilin-type N-terminal cleavage/methylation domain-containing protein